MTLVVKTDGETIFRLRNRWPNCDPSKIARGSQRVQLCRECVEFCELCNGVHWVARNSSIACALDIEVVVAMNKYCSVIDVAQNECHGK